MTFEAQGQLQFKTGLRMAILGARGIPARYGGFETFAEQLAVRLVERGHHVTVYAETDQRGQVDSVYKGVRVRHMMLPKLGAASVIAFDCRSLWDARRGHDVVYMLGYGAAWACWLPRFFGTPVWLNVDGLEWARSKWGRVAKVYLRWMEWFSSWVPTRVIADARAISDHYLRAYPHGSPCSYIAYGAPQVDGSAVDPALLSQWGLQVGRFLLVVARAEPENHLSEMIQGFLMHPCPWPLVVVGDVSGATPYQRHLLSIAGDRVHFVGGIYDSRELTCLRTYAAFYLHGHSVGGTNPSLLEALACGSRVIAHDNVFNREVARDVAEYFKTPEELALCIQRMINMDPKDREFRVQQARSIISDHYTWEKIADQYEALMLAQIVNGQAPQ